MITDTPNTGISECLATMTSGTVDMPVASPPMVRMYLYSAGVSVITNEAHDDYAPDYENDGDDVVKAADAAADRMCALFTRMIESL